jgi:hypothetical protein
MLQRGPAAVVNDRPVLLSERATHSCLLVTKIWSWTPDGGLTARQTGQLTVGHNITLTLTFVAVSQRTAGVQSL